MIGHLKNLHFVFVLQSALTGKGYDEKFKGKLCSIAHLALQHRSPSLSLSHSSSEALLPLPSCYFVFKVLNSTHKGMIS